MSARAAMRSVFFRVIPIEPLFPVARTLDAANESACDSSAEQEGEGNVHCSETIDSDHTHLHKKKYSR